VKFLAIKEFGDKDLKQDFHFLEDMAQVSDAARRGLRGIGTMRVPAA